MMTKSFCRCISTTRSAFINKNPKLQHQYEENKNERSQQHNEERIRNLLDHSIALVDTKPVYDEDRWATLPYAQGTKLTKSTQRELDIRRPRIDPADTSIILFPGSGSQFLGMAKSIENVPAAKDVFDCASEILK